MRSALVAIVVLASACTTGTSSEFAGVWQSEGYGMFLTVQGTGVSLYEHTTAHCLQTAETSTRGLGDVAIRDGERLVLVDDGGRVMFEQIASLPPRCNTPVVADAEAVRVALIATIDEHLYPAPDPGWADGVSAESELWGDLVTLLEALADPRLRLVDPDGRFWSPEQGAVWGELGRRLGQDSWLAGSAVAGDGGIVTAELAHGVRYLGLLRMGPFDASTAESEQELLRALDGSLRGASGLIVDLRSATDGSEAMAMLVATRFVSEQTIVARRRVRTADGGLVDGGVIAANPLSQGPTATPTVVLIGPGTTGAAELLVMALDDRPGVTLIGEPSAGLPGSPLVRTLPNGWRLAVPNLAIIEGAGDDLVGGPISPDLLAPLTPDHIASGDDPGLEAALTLLSG